MWRRRHLVPMCALGLAMLPGCGGSPTPSASPSRASASAPPPTSTVKPTPTADTPDTLVLTTPTSGFGRYQLITIPVAVVKNTATTHWAIGITVTFQVIDARNRVLVTATDTLGGLAPGDSAIAAGNTEPPGVATRITVATAVAHWSGTAGVRFQAAPAAYHCQRCTSGPTNGDVIATVTASTATFQNPVHVGAICLDKRGGVVGGGAGPFVWPTGTASASVAEAVLVAASPSTCSLTVSPVGG